MHRYAASSPPGFDPNYCFISWVSPLTKWREFLRGGDPNTLVEENHCQENLPHIWLRADPMR